MVDKGPFRCDDTSVSTVTSWESHPCPGKTKKFGLSWASWSVSAEDSFRCPEIASPMGGSRTQDDTYTFGSELVSPSPETFEVPLESDRVVVEGQEFLPGHPSGSEKCLALCPKDGSQSGAVAAAASPWGPNTSSTGSLFPDDPYLEMFAETFEIAQLSIPIEESSKNSNFPELKMETGPISLCNSKGLLEIFEKSEQFEASALPFETTIPNADVQMLGEEKTFSFGEFGLMPCHGNSNPTAMIDDPFTDVADINREDRGQDKLHSVENRDSLRSQLKGETDLAGSGNKIVFDEEPLKAKAEDVEKGVPDCSEDESVDRNEDILNNSSSSFSLWDSPSGSSVRGGNTRRQRPKVHQKPPTTLGISLENLKEVFHLHRPEAERHLNLKRTTFSNLSRYYGISKWPFRTLRDADKRIAHNRELLQRPSTGREKRRKLEIQQRRLRAVKQLMYTEPHQSKDSNTLSVLLNLVAERENRRPV